MENSVYEAKFQLITRGQWATLGGIAAFSILLTLSFPPFFFFALGYFLIPFLTVVISSLVRKDWTVFVYKDRVEFVSTFIRMKTKRLEASKIESVDVRDTLLGNKLYGSVIVRGSGMANLKFFNIKSQQELAERIRAISSAPHNKETVAKSSSNSNTGNLVSDLKGLEQLKKDGVISESEFQELKKKAIQGD